MDNPLFKFLDTVILGIYVGTLLSLKCGAESANSAAMLVFCGFAFIQFAVWAGKTISARRSKGRRGRRG